MALCTVPQTQQHGLTELSTGSAVSMLANTGAKHSKCGCCDWETELLVLKFFIKFKLSHVAGGNEDGQHS